MPKVYFTDLGIRNFLVNDFRLFAVRSDRGPLLEGGIFRQLIDSFGGEAVKFWRTAAKQEVDFILEAERLALEVKAGERPVRRSKYAAFIRQYPDFRLKFISRANWLDWQGVVLRN